jgi:hypothetical protein
MAGDSAVSGSIVSVGGTGSVVAVLVGVGAWVETAVSVTGISVAWLTGSSSAAGADWQAKTNSNKMIKDRLYLFISSPHAFN